MKKEIFIFMIIFIISGIFMNRIAAKEIEEEMLMIEFHLAQLIDYVPWNEGYTRESEIGKLEYTQYRVSQDKKDDLITAEIYPDVLFSEEEIEQGWKVAGYGYWNTDRVYVPKDEFDQAVMNPPSFELAGSGYEGISNLVVYIIKDKIGEGEENRVDIPDGIDDRNEVIIRFLDQDDTLISAQVIETESRMKWACAEDMSGCDNIEFAKLYVQNVQPPIHIGWSFKGWDTAYENIRFYEDTTIKAIYEKEEELYISLPKIITLDGKGEIDTAFSIGIKGGMKENHSLRISIEGIDEGGYLYLKNSQDENIQIPIAVFFCDEQDLRKNKIESYRFEEVIDDKRLIDGEYILFNGILKKVGLPAAGSYLGKFLFKIEMIENN